jgi:hypothetical protein
MSCNEPSSESVRFSTTSPDGLKTYWWRVGTGVVREASYRVVKLESGDFGHEAEDLKSLEDTESSRGLGVSNRCWKEFGAEKLDMSWLSDMTVAEA